MLTCVFILGRPGSGKSSIAQQIVFIFRHYGWDVEYLYDYQLLQKLFLTELDNLPLNENERRFIPRGPQGMYGFDVLDFSVLDEVLQDIAIKAIGISQRSSLQNKSLLLIEFSRNDYRKALSVFDHTLLHDAHLIYVESAFKACLERIGHRIDHKLPFGHFVSDKIMWQYYLADDWLNGQCQRYLKEIEKSGIYTNLHHITNNGSQDELKQKVYEIVKTHFLKETETMPIVQDTENIPAVSRVIPQNEPSK